MINYPALKTEVQADPAALGYASYVAEGNDQGVADLLNWARDGATAPPGKPVGAAVSVRRSDVSSSELLEAINSLDLDTTASAALLAWFQSLMTQPRARLLRDDGSNTNVIGNLQRLIPLNVNGTRTRLSAVASRFGSRAEQLFGSGTVVGNVDVAIAFGRTGLS